MKRHASWLWLWAVAPIGSAITAQAANEARYVHTVETSADESPEEILKKAAQVVPNRQQVLYHQDEFTAFVHFGINTFTGVEWGSGLEKATVFAPGEEFNTDQWCEIFRDAGMRKVVITVKHHDGFCLWQSRYNDEFSVRAVPWRDGKGDVLGDLSASCKKYGLKLGVYLSPADLYQIESPTGWYGNLSEYQETVIPTDPESFATDPSKPRADRPEDAPTFRVSADDYNRYFMNQLYELLTEYGPIHEVWFDGAHPKRKGGQKYIKGEWFQMIRKLAPDAAIFGGPDLRWCGNEAGYTRESEWSVLPVESIDVSGVDRPQENVGNDESVVAKEYQVYGTTYKRRGLQYLISEVDTSIRAGWFWRNEHEQAVRTPDDVLDIYERSVGGNAGLLLNAPPDVRGLIPARDEACLREVGRRIRATYDANLLDNATVEGADTTALSDGDQSTYWRPSALSGEFVVRLSEPQTINRFVLQEAVAEVGQRVKQHALDAWVDGAWREVAAATTIGWKRILRFPEVTTDRFRVRVLDARLEPGLTEISAHYYNEPPPAVAVQRAADGDVTLAAVDRGYVFQWKADTRSDRPASKDDDVRIYFTIDGQTPDEEALVYTKPFRLPNGGAIQARSFQDGRWGPLLTKRLGIDNADWQAVRNSSANPPQLAFDNKIDTAWRASGEDRANLTIDLGREISIDGIVVTPPQQGQRPVRMVGAVEVSTGGDDWQTVTNFDLGNLRNDPSERSIEFSGSHAARRIRISLEGAGGIAEIAVLAAPMDAE